MWDFTHTCNPIPTDFVKWTYSRWEILFLCYIGYFWYIESSYYSLVFNRRGVSSKLSHLRVFSSNFFTIWRVSIYFCQPTFWIQFPTISYPFFIPFKYYLFIFFFNLSLFIFNLPSFISYYYIFQIPTNYLSELLSLSWELLSLVFRVVPLWCLYFLVSLRCFPLDLAGTFSQILHPFSYLYFPSLTFPFHLSF